MPRLSISLLGPKVILLDGKPVRAFTYYKAMALLAYLAVEVGVPHSRQTLVGLLWPDLANAAALTNLRQVLADLRQVIGDEDASPPFLLITRESIQFNAESDYQLDTTTFLHAISNCDSHRHRHIDRCRICQTRLADAIELYRGDFLSGFSVDDADPFEEWVTLRREEFHERARQLLGNLANYQLRNRNDERAHYYLRRQVELEPWQEEAHQQLMRLYARNGQRSSALVQFEECQRILRREFAVEPSPQTKRLYAQIRDGLPLDEEANAQQRFWHNLPLAATSLVGRDGELAQLGELLADPAHRLITILGPGGIGKTRLALAAAAENAVDFGNGVLFVSLAGMSDARFLPNAILSALETPLAPEQTPQEQLIAVLRGQQLLLLLDNYEQLLPNVELLNHLLRLGRGVTILVTSRERLAMQAEHLHEISGLDYPRTITNGASIAVLEQYSALQLFVQRARQVQHNFAPTSVDVAAILRIGRITEGMPLALELAAAAVRVQPCEVIAKALENGQQVLSTQMRDLPERQRSMQAVFAHSMRLLAAEEHRVFCALAFFRGGFTAEAAAEVAQAPQYILAVLVDKSLLRVSPTYRYDMHELTRQFAESELEASGEAMQVRERYHAYFVALAKAASQKLEGAQQGMWIARLEQEIDNLRAVLEGLRQETPEMALSMAYHLYWFFHSRSYLQEGLEWYSGAATPNAQVEPFFQARVYGAACFFSLCLGRVDEASAWVTKSLTIFRTLDLADPRIAEGYLYSLTRQSFVFLFQKEYERALAVSREARQLAQAVGSKYFLSVGWYNAGEVYSMQEKFEQSQSCYEQSLALVREIDNVRAVGQRSARLANVVAAQGDLERARSLCHQALAIYAECHDHVGLTMALLVLVRLANIESDFRRAALLLGATDKILDTSPIVRTWPQDHRSYHASMTILREQLNDDTFDLLWAKGRSMSLEQTIALALSDEA
jgi:predicted ATPase/DNA-binding SARP family transcriptional activator